MNASVVSKSFSSQTLKFAHRVTGYLSHTEAPPADAPPGSWQQGPESIHNGHRLCEQPGPQCKPERTLANASLMITATPARLAAASADPAEGSSRFQGACTVSNSRTPSTCKVSACSSTAAWPGPLKVRPIACRRPSGAPARHGQRNLPGRRCPGLRNGSGKGSSSRLSSPGSPAIDVAGPGVNAP